MRGAEKKQQMAQYKEKIETELGAICNDVVLSLLEKFLIPKTSQAQSKVFNLKRKGALAGVAPVGWNVIPYTKRWWV